MAQAPDKPVKFDALHVLVDQRLIDSSALERLDAPERETVENWRQQRAALQSLHQEVLSEPVPATLLQAAQGLDKLQQGQNQGGRWAAMAAGVLLSFGLGWLSHGRLGDFHDSSAPLAQAKQQEFVRQASYAHAVYLPEMRHPVEVAATDQEHLVQWLSKRLGKPIRVPDLAVHGFELVGGRLLPGELGPRAQFMFANPQGTRVTLYLGGVGKLPTGADARETRFEFSAEGPTQSFYWFDQGFGYALSGQISRENLMTLATQVYQQLRSPE